MYLYSTLYSALVSCILPGILSVFCAHKYRAVFRIYSLRIVRVLLVYFACISRYLCPGTEVCTLEQLQRRVKYAKVMKGGSIQVKNMLEMGQLLQPLLMPAQVCDLVPAAEGALSVPVRDMLYVPMDAAAFDVHGACFTGPMQVKWIGQGSRFNVQTVFKRSLETLFSNGVQTFEHLLKMVLTHGHIF